MNAGNTTIRFRTAAITFILSSLWGAGAAAAPHAVIEAYAQRHGFHTRKVRCRVGGKTLERIFVPVTRGSEADFLQQFNADNGYVIWRHRDADVKHANLMLSATDHVGFSAKPHSDLSSYTNANQPGRYVPMKLAQNQIQHMVQRFEQVGNVPMHTRAKAREMVPGFQERTDAGCMWWLVHAETAPGVNLATALGISRSKAPENLIRKILHGSNKVSVVGVPLQDNQLASFDQMTDEQLMGPPPKGRDAPQPTAQNGQ